MDAKRLAQLREIHAQVVAGDFGELEINSLLITLREGAPSNGPVRELSDFVAHRLRDKGPVHRFMKGMVTAMDKYRAGQAVVFSVGLVFTEAGIASAFNQEFEKHGLTPLDTQRSRQLQLIILSLLQHAEMQAAKKKFGVLTLSINAQAVRLMGLVDIMARPGVPVKFGSVALEVVNDFYPMHGNAEVKPDGLLTVCVRNGEVELQGIKPYFVHVGRKRLRGQPQPLPITWTEVETVMRVFPVLAKRAEVQEFDVAAYDGSPVTFTLRDGRLSFLGHAAHFAVESPVWRFAYALREVLGARVFNDSSSYLFETVESVKQLEPE